MTIPVTVRASSPSVARAVLLRSSALLLAVSLHLIAQPSRPSVFPVPAPANQAVRLPGSLIFAAAIARPPFVSASDSAPAPLPVGTILRVTRSFQLLDDEARLFFQFGSPVHKNQFESPFPFCSLERKPFATGTLTFHPGDTLVIAGVVRRSAPAMAMHPSTALWPDDDEPSMVGYLYRLRQDARVALLACWGDAEHLPTISRLRFDLGDTFSVTLPIDSSTASRASAVTP